METRPGQAGPAANPGRGACALLGGRWLFDPRAPKPLAIGIHTDIICACELGPAESFRLRKLLGRWTGRAAYLKALAAPGAQRCGLDAQPVEAVSLEHQAAAREQLEYLRLKRARRTARQQRVQAKANACRANAAKPVLRLGAPR